LPSTRADDDDHLEQLKDKSRRILQEENGLLRRQMSTLMEHVDSLQRDQRLLLDEVQRARGESHSLRLRLEQADGDCRRATVRLRHALEELARMRAEQSEMVDQQQQCRSYAELQTKRRASRRAQ
jgi:chromosome segregation ATPase